MFVRDLLRSLLRRWYFVFIGLVATAAMCMGVYQVVPVSYQATASFLMLPPKTTVGTGGNPFLYLGGLGQALDVLSLRVQSAPVSDPIIKLHPGATFATGPDPSTSGPVLMITATAKSSATAEATLKAVGEQLPVQLTELQEDLKVPAPSRIGLLKLTSDAEPTLVQKTRFQVLAAVGALGAVGAVLLTGLLDGLLISRRRRKSEQGDRGEGRRKPAKNTGQGVPAPDDDLTSRAPSGKPQPDSNEMHPLSDAEFINSEQIRAK